MFLKEAKPKSVEQKPATHVHVYSVFDVIFTSNISDKFGNNSFYLSFLTRDKGVKAAIDSGMIVKATKEISGETIKQMKEPLQASTRQAKKAGYVIGTLNIANPDVKGSDGEEAKAYLQSGYLSGLIEKGDTKVAEFLQRLIPMTQEDYFKQRKSSGKTNESNNLNEADGAGAVAAKKARELLKQVLPPAARRPFDLQLSTLALKADSTEEEVNKIMDSVKEHPQYIAPKETTPAKAAVSPAKIPTNKPADATKKSQQPAMASSGYLRFLLQEGIKNGIIKEHTGGVETGTDEMLYAYESFILGAAKKLHNLDLKGRLTVINEKNGEHIDQVISHIVDYALKEKDPDNKIVLHTRDPLIVRWANEILKRTDNVYDKIEFYQESSQKRSQEETAVVKPTKKMTNKEMEERVFMEVKNLIGKITNS